MGNFLRLFFGCHGRADRSFFFHEKQFPICARCTGELVGILCGIPTAFFVGYVHWLMIIIMMMPMIIDGFIQLYTPYQSNNAKRFFSGLLFGMGLVFIFVYFHCGCIKVAGFFLKLFMEADKVEKGMQFFLP